MQNLILEFVNKTRAGYIAFVSNTEKIITNDNIFIPNKIYKWYKIAPDNESISYRIKPKQDIITATKVLRNNKYYMKIEFDHNTLYIPNGKFNKIAKSYCFQTFVDIKVLDGNNQLVFQNYKFLKNYDIRSKAFYYTDKLIKDFSKFYARYFIDNKLSFNIIDKVLELYHNGVLYENQYVFRTRDGNGYAVYTFMIISIEKI